MTVIINTFNNPPLGWAAREALVFLARISHSDLGADESNTVVAGGGVARDPVVMQLLASVLDRRVLPHTGGDSALRGLAAIAMGALLPSLGTSASLLAGYGVLWWRVRHHKLTSGESADVANVYATACAVGKLAEFQGVARYAWNRWVRRRRGGLIEYKK